jgi:outer membrane protein OmpA-like peptidoglycan-associated protein
MKAAAAISSAKETAARSPVKAKENQAQTAAAVNLTAIPDVIRVLQRKSFCPCDGGCPSCLGDIQPKLTIGQPNDKYEQEADRAADQVMRMPERKESLVTGHWSLGKRQKDSSLVNGHSSLVQRQAGCTGPACTEEEEPLQTKSIGDRITPLDYVQRQEETVPEEEEEEEEPAQLKSLDNKSPPVTTGLQHQIQSLSAGGQPLSADIRSFFESRFSRDFSDVRVHTGPQAAETARAIHARAFTLGKDVVFGTGQYQPASREGRRLLAHELTHTVQQSKDRNSSLIVQREGDPTQIPPGMACPPAASTPSGTSSVFEFPNARTDLNALQKAEIENFVINWHALGGNINVRLDGYASKPGPDRLNWTLSCDRALAVQAELMSPSSGATPGIPGSYIEMYAHGETDEFSTAGSGSDRRVNLYIPSAPPVPPHPVPPHPVPPRDQFICGPDISTPLRNVFTNIQTWFRSTALTDFQRARSCAGIVGNLISFVNPIMAWDIRQLFLPNTSWLAFPPHFPPCGSPASGAPASDDRENATTSPCGNSVQVGSRCFLAGTANYGTYGIMCKLCFDHYLRMVISKPWLLPFMGTLSDYSEGGMITRILLYKSVSFDNPIPPIAWALAAYWGGPGAVPSGGENRSHCTDRCPAGNSRTLPFSFVWEPYMAR